MNEARTRSITALPVLALAIGVFALTVMAGAFEMPAVVHATGATLAIDADISDGACVDIDATGSMVGGSSTQVALCLDNPGVLPVSGFGFNVLYDDTLIVAPEVADVSPATSLDDNPDANVGATTFTSSTYPNALGSGWTCEGGVGAYPQGDAWYLGVPGDGIGYAFSGGCNSPGPYTLIAGPLSVITFDFLSYGTAALTIESAAVTDYNGSRYNEIGSCAPVVDVPMTCTGATITREPDMGLYVDLDTADGVCTGVEVNPTRTVDAGTAFDIAMCFQNRPFTPETLVGFNYGVVYDDTIIRAPEEDDRGTGNDDNPDANAGVTTFGSTNLGPAWLCNGSGVFPNGDVNGTAFDGAGQASSGSCYWPSYPSPPNNGMNQGALGVIHLTTGAPGTTALSYPGSSSVTPYSSGTGLTFSCDGSVADLFCYGGSITVLCVQPDAECDGADDGFDNCLALYNPDQFNTDSDPRDNGPLAPGDDETSMTTDAPGDACDTDDDNDGIADLDEAVHPVSGCASATAAIDPQNIDSDGDHLHDGWECANGSDPADAASKFMGTGGSTDVDADRIPDDWEQRGYNGSGASTDSDGDGCHDLVEIASIDGNTTVAMPDSMAAARAALGIWPPEPDQDYVLDIDKNGTVGIADRLFVARAALLPDWLPKSCP